MVNHERMLNEFLEMIQIDSETKNEGPFADHLIGILTTMGFEITRDTASKHFPSNTDNVIAKKNGGKQSPPILLSSHLDTVSPGKGIKPVVGDYYITSDGTTILGGDDKAGIAAILEGIRILDENKIPYPPVELVFTIAEEGGLNGSRYLDYSMIASKRGLVLDSGGAPGEIIIQGPAQDRINVVIKGKPAHAGVCPEDGISAIQVAAEAIHQMSLLRIDAETTANIGMIHGGIATNIVCPDVTINAEARSLDNDKLDIQTAHMKACFESAAAKFGAVAEINIDRPYVAFKMSPDHELVRLVTEACGVLGFKAYTTKTGGGSDTNNYNEKGVAAINLGVGMEKPHTLEERIALVNLYNSALMVAEILKRA
jgi:tripeptide aminopeptidase